MAPPPGAPTPNPLMAAFSAGVVFALFQGGFYKLGEMFGGGGAGGSKEQQQQQYLRVKAMLQSLNLPVSTLARGVGAGGQGAAAGSGSVAHRCIEPTR